ncbi:hypothetical protein AQUCO_07500014v1 [Aquilegia coerulea]|uniref:Uncharacterized protein n=1 Tax=Aquilegia coerulea TaxID=218851 RepID=A0A2G5C959_AQUCA|nr:hypothetical protein AQUCO_07500014v1 [Aquilegia coerulea]
MFLALEPDNVADETSVVAVSVAFVVTFVVVADGSSFLADTVSSVADSEGSPSFVLESLGLPSSFTSAFSPISIERPWRFDIASARGSGTPLRLFNASTMDSWSSDE